MAAQGCGRLGYDPVALPNNPVALFDAGAEDVAIDAATARDTGDILMPDALGPIVDASPHPQDSTGSFDASGNAPTNITLPYLQDFEALSTAWSGKIIGTDAVVERDKSRPHGGDASLKCSKGVATGLRYLEVALAKALTTGEVYSRVFLYAPSSWSVESWLIPMEMKGTTTHDNKFSFDLSLTGYGTNLSGVGSSTTANATLPRDKWVCVELALSLSATKGWPRLYVDGKLADEHLNVHTLLSDSDPGIERFRVGLNPAATQGIAEIWFDDWAIATARIGCL